MSHTVIGEPVATVGALAVYVREEKNKSTGGRRVFVQVRQRTGKTWRVAEILSFSNAGAVDVKLEEVPADSRQRRTRRLESVSK